MKQLHEFTFGDCYDIAEEASKRYAANYTLLFDEEPPTISSAMVEIVLKVATELAQRKDTTDESAD